MFKPDLSRIFALSVLVASTMVPASYGDDCSPIRLDETVRTKDGRIIEGSMVHVAVRNQKQIGSCYAHTSAQMYDAWRFKHGENTQEDYKNFSSGFEIGQRFKIDENEATDLLGLWSPETDINGGFVNRLLPFLLEEGTCSQLKINEIFEKQYHLSVDTYASAVMARLNARRTAFHLERDLILEKYRLTLDDVEPKEASILARVKAMAPLPFPDFKLRPAKPSSAAIDKEKRIKLAKIEIDRERTKALYAGLVELKESHRKYLADKTLNVDYSSLLNEARGWTSKEVNTVKLFELLGVIKCNAGEEMKTRGRFTVETTESYSDGGLIGPRRPNYYPKASKKAVNAELNKGWAKAYPIGIAYCSKIFKAGRAFEAQDWSDNDKCGRHASMIIGRRRDPKSNRCQFLIRNTWGKSCSSYHSDWDCEREKGSVWIDVDTLGQAIHDTQTLRTIYD